jgi:RNA polymerase sigma-70 factor (ECF subfamily)
MGRRTAGIAEAAFDADSLLTEVGERGDREAFARLYEYFAPRIKAYLLKVGAAADHAEDLAQETMVKVWRKAALYQSDKASAATWMFTIARNVRIDAHRRASRPDLDPNEPGIAPEPEPQADETVARNERDAAILRIFGRLPENQREVVALHFYEDEPHTSIAERLNIPLGTVKSRLRLAFARIRRELEEFEQPG